MSSKTKIVVLHMKEIIYTGIFLLFLLILGVVMLFMFGPGKTKTTSAEVSDLYTPESTVLPFLLMATALMWKLL